RPSITLVSTCLSLTRTSSLGWPPVKPAGTGVVNPLTTESVGGGGPKCRYHGDRAAESAESLARRRPDWQTDQDARVRPRAGPDRHGNGARHVRAALGEHPPAGR